MTTSRVATPGRKTKSHPNKLPESKSSHKAKPPRAVPLAKAAARPSGPQAAPEPAAAPPTVMEAVEIHFHGLEKSDAVETKIRTKVAKLKRHFSRLTACRVVLDAPNRGPAKPKILKVKIEMSVPGRKPLVVEHERVVAHVHDDMNLVLRDAFDTATRRIDEVAERLGARVRQERGRRRPAPMTL